MRAHRLFSSKDRPIHYGEYPLHRLRRQAGQADLTGCHTDFLSFSRPDDPENIVNAMAEHQAMLDTIRDGLLNGARADIPADPKERSNHLKSFGYFNDSSMVGIGPVTDSMWLDEPVHNPAIDDLAAMIQTRQTKTLAAGIDQIMADLKDSVSAPPRQIGHHHSAIVFLCEYRRDPRPDETGAAWIQDAQDHRGCLLTSETAIVIANYMRLLGFDAKAHTLTSSDICLQSAVVAAGLGWNEQGQVVVPYLGTRYGVAVVTTDMDLAHDLPLAPRSAQPRSDLTGLNWKLGRHSNKSAFNRDPFATRDYRASAMKLERLKRVETPTTYIDESNIPRVPKRTDMFARSQFGDMGKANQDAATGGYYARKAAPSYAQRRALGAFVLLQDGPENDAAPPVRDAAWYSDQIKATSYFLGVDAVGLSRCPDWSWYSHDARGDAITPPHDQAISMVIDQGFETMEGASGDDWISVAQSMRAYLRFSMLGGVIAKQIRNLGFTAKAHTVLDGDVLQPPLLLLGGLGEVSRIGEVILHPFLGPRLKSGVVTTTLPLDHDRPIDFGLQNFCESCQKCARECPSGAITAGPKVMFNGYETWKSDSQKCTTYRITTKGGAMCGRCMKTCPWNLEGLFAESPFRWAASNLPMAAKALATLDDMAGRGGLNDVKKWWWDLELCEDGAYRPTSHPVNRRGLSRDLKLRAEDQTMAVYPAPLAPHPYPYPFPMDREAGIRAFEALVSAGEYRRRIAAGDTDHIHRYVNGDSHGDDSPVIQAVVQKVEVMSSGISKYVFAALDGAPLPVWAAGAHIDVLVAPGMMRQYSMSGDPANRDVYEVAVLREEQGRGGSLLMHRIFAEGRRVFISRPINHFELQDNAGRSFLMGGGIGVTPMVAFGHTLHAQGRDFALHYSVSNPDDLAFAGDLRSFDWADHVFEHVSSQGGRADLAAIFAGATAADHVYVCGPDGYMDAVLAAAAVAGIPDDNLHREYFSVPEQPDYENYAFELVMRRSGRRIRVAADETASDALVANGYAIDVKCADGLCGVCKCGVISGEVEHRDFVLSDRQRADSIILCQSRAAKEDGVLELDL
ncbi:2Fe-2S iron-sulfur cluster-binding protein [Alphaproteobacteria bacterium LSUCC0719]